MSEGNSSENEFETQNEENLTTKAGAVHDDEFFDMVGASTFTEKMQAHNVQKDHEHRDREYRLRELKVTEVLKAWKETQTHERDLRKEVFQWVMGLMGILVIVGSVSFWAIGYRWLNIPNQWIADVFFGSVFVGVGGLASSIVKGLFPEKKEDTLSEMNKIVEKL